MSLDRRLRIIEEAAEAVNQHLDLKRMTDAQLMAICGIPPDAAEAEIESALAQIIARG